MNFCRINNTGMRSTPASEVVGVAWSNAAETVTSIGVVL